MPRPGPRPYECVRRAWHSDRHQPMRGSLIQEIFRVVNEIHTPQTKKNKEWQEKLPVVVLKAEEIIYSKANSEAEYMDLQTLRERTNDAINTIIRREEGVEETGDLLQPCIEAALILGCTARRASRSQRNSNPRSYLTPTTQETTPTPTPSPSSAPSTAFPRVIDNMTHGGSSHVVPLHSSKPTFVPHVTPYRSTTIRPCSQLRLESSSHQTHDSNPSMSHVFPFSLQNTPSPSNQVVPLETNATENLGHIYPLYYGLHHQTTDTQLVYQPSDRAMAQAQSTRKTNEKDFLQNFITWDGVVNASSRTVGDVLRSTAERASQNEYDLSLRLGSLSTPGASTVSRFTHEVADIGSDSSQEGSKSCGSSPRTSKEYCFFPREYADDTLKSSSSRWNSKGKSVDVDGSTREHKEPVSNLVETAHSSHHSKFFPELFFGRMNNPDK